VKPAGRHRAPAAPPRNPSDVELRPASELSPAELAALFTAGYEGYDFPVELDEAAFTAMAALSDFDLGLSRIALREAQPVGIAVIGVRGAAGWIGGLGVTIPERRLGVGRKLMESVLHEAHEAGVTQVSLEVLEPNSAAIALYDQLGFERTRMLEVWTLRAGAGPSSAEAVASSEAAEWIRANRRSPEPWQRADRSLANVARGGQEVEALIVPDRGAALYRVAGDVVSVLQLAARDEKAAAELLRAMRRRAGSLRFVNVPEGDPAASALRKLGGELEVRQLEMERALNPAGGG
jgi:GNAT superfamily N-acetyltransferase